MPNTPTHDPDLTEVVANVIRARRFPTSVDYRLAGETLDAIEPVLRAKIAEEIEEAAAGIAYHEGNDEDLVKGMFDAASIARGGHDG